MVENLMRAQIVASILFAGSAVASSVLHAQRLTSGEWSGWIEAPIGPRKPNTYDVSYRGDSLYVVMREVPEDDPIPLEGIRIAGDTLSYTWTNFGLVKTCVLMLQSDGSYLGGCKDPVGGQGRMRMVPPGAP